MENFDILINESNLDKRIEELAKEIMRDYKDEDLVFVGVLKGAAVFMIELAKKIKNSVDLYKLKVIKELKVLEKSS